VESAAAPVGADSTVHGWFQRFVVDGVMEEIWAELVRECDQLGAVTGNGRRPTG
jgi:hypothetical protein